MAFLLLLETLSPSERAAYLLHEVFDYTHGEVASILGKNETACRQLCHRACQHIAERRPRFAPSRERHRLVLTQFMQACATGDLEGLERLLANDVTVWTDGGGKASAALKPVHGKGKAARLLIGLSRKLPEPVAVEILEINGGPSLVVRSGEQVSFVLTLETDGQSIHGVFAVRNPEKLSLSRAVT
jgi:RNA polymerase sigma-70 factor (ECF subfamily)